MHKLSPSVPCCGKGGQPAKVFTSMRNRANRHGLAERHLTTMQPICSVATRRPQRPERYVANTCLSKNDITRGRLEHRRMNPLLRTPDSMAMRSDALASNGTFPKIDDLVVETMSRTLGPTLPPRFKRDPKQNTALRWSLDRNRYLKQGAADGTSFHCRPYVTNSS